MKTLKQIREEYDNKLLSQIVSGDEDVLEEYRLSKPSLDKKTISTGPSYKQMPAMLLFRRITYRQYPGGQTVALYYSALVDKYLSIPFGPTGNLNLSEAVILDNLEEGWRNTLIAVGKSMPGYGDKEASKAAWKKGDYLGAAKSQAKAIGKAGLTGLAAAVFATGALAAGAGVTFAGAALTTATGISSAFSVAALAVSVLTSLRTSATGGAGTQLLYAAGIPINSYTISTVWYYLLIPIAFVSLY